MATESLLMQLIQQTWQVSTALFPYLVLATVVTATYLRRPDTTELTSCLRYGLNTIVMERRQHIVYGTVLAGIILHLMPNAPVFAYTLALAFYTHAMFKTIENPPEHTEGSNNPYKRWTGVLVYTAALLGAIASITIGTSLIQTLTAVYIYGIIFWNL